MISVIFELLAAFMTMLYIFSLLKERISGMSVSNLEALTLKRSLMNQHVGRRSLASF